MDSQSIILPKLMPRDGVIDRVTRILWSLKLDTAWRLEITEHKPKRSDNQNRYLWAIYAHILKVGGETMGGWTKDDLHEFFLGEHFGWDKRVLFGRPRLVPMRRSSRLDKMEFVDFVDFIQKYMAERGVFIPDAENWEQAA